MTVFVVLLPYNRVTRASGFASTDEAIDNIGVMPDPAAMHR